MSMRVLIADKLAAQTVEELRSLGLAVDVQPDLSEADLPAAVGDANVLIVRSTKVNAATIEAGKRLSLIVRAGAGVNTIDVAAASQRGIYVSNCPGKNAAAVAELAIGLLIACDRQIVAAANDLRKGQWMKKKYGAAHGLRGRTLGVIGLGEIGRAVVRAAQGLEMNVLAWSRSLTDELAEGLGVERAADKIELARRADAVSIHIAAGAGTKHFIDSEFFAALREGAIFINTARGDVVDTAALKQAIANKKLRVGVDVYEGEPAGGDGAFDDTELAALVTGTPHIGASTDQASEAIAEETVHIIRTYRQTGRPPHAVNLCGRSPATHALVVRHFNRVGVLAGVLDLLRAESINVEEMENTIFESAQAACCTLQLDTQPSGSLIEKLNAMENVLQITVEAR